MAGVRISWPDEVFNACKVHLLRERLFKITFHWSLMARQSFLCQKLLNCFSRMRSRLKKILSRSAVEKIDTCKCRHRAKARDLRKWFTECKPFILRRLTYQQFLAIPLAYSCLNRVQLCGKWLMEILHLRELINALIASEVKIEDNIRGA